MNLQLNQTSDLRTLKMLNIIDEFTREFVPIDVGKLHFPTVVVHPFRLKLYSDSDVVVHPGRS